MSLHQLYQKAFLPTYCFNTDCFTDFHQIQNVIKLIVYQVLIPIFALFGVVGNILSLFILSQPQFIDSLYIYLKGLAIADLGYLIMALQASVILCFDPDSSRMTINEKSLTSYIRMCLNPLWNAFIGASDFIVVFMTFNRLVALINIRKVDVEPFDKKKKAVIFNIIVAFSLSFIMHIPTVFDINTPLLCNNTSNMSENILKIYPHIPFCDELESKNKKNMREDFFFYYIYAYEILLKILPSILIIALNLAIMRKLMQIWAQRKKVSVSYDASPKTRRGTSAISFIILQPPAVLLELKVAEHFVQLKKKLKPKKRRKKVMLPFIGKFRIINNGFFILYIFCVTCILCKHNRCS